MKTVKKDKSLKIALDSKESKDSCDKMRPHMFKMEEELNQIFTEVTRVQNEPLWISKMYFEYAYGQLKNPKEQVDNASLRKREET